MTLDDFLRLSGCVCLSVLEVGLVTGCDWVCDYVYVHERVATLCLCEWLCVPPRVRSW